MISGNSRRLWNSKLTSQKKKKHPGNVDYSKQFKLEYLLKGFALSMKTSTKFNILEMRNILISLKLLFGELSAWLTYSSSLSVNRQGKPYFPTRPLWNICFTSAERVFSLTFFLALSALLSRLAEQRILWGPSRLVLVLHGQRFGFLQYRKFTWELS